MSIPSHAATPDRTELQRQLSSTAFFKHSDGPRFFHGRFFHCKEGSDQAPQVTWQSKVLPRDDHGSTADWLTATEYCDHPEVTDAKCTALAQLIQMSQKTVIYSGAGISVPALIGQAAKGSSDKGSKSTDAWPTKTHFALGALGRHGKIHGWVQQNHDGLPQKAGFPQENINEIHGSWFDPSNPVVLYSGTLKEDAYPRMIHDADTADLVIVVGTSLGGLNADQVANKTAKRSLRNKPWKADGSGGALGTVIINLQQTEQDGKATLRLFGTTDTVLPRVLEKLGLAEASNCRCGKRFCREANGYMYTKPTRQVTSAGQACSWQLKLRDENTGKMQPTEPSTFQHRQTDRQALVPYDKDGKRTEDGNTTKMVLDLRNGQAIKITAGHNIKGAGQPQSLHIGATKPYTRPAAYGGQTMQPGPGHGKVKAFCTAQSSLKLEIEGVVLTLGAWWLDAACRGELETLPIVNMQPVFKTAGNNTAAAADVPESTPVQAASQPNTTSTGSGGSNLEVGNLVTSSLDKKNKDSKTWTVYVKGSDVTKTTFHLHPTFSPSKVTVAPDVDGVCRLQRTGWGTFDIMCEVTLCDGAVVRKNHPLVFAEAGSRKVYSLLAPE